MSTLPYHPRYHSDALRGMAKLNLEQRGAYNLILDLQYEAGGPIEDDDAWLARQANTTTKKWRRLKAELQAMGKLLIGGGLISNPRATFEIDQIESRQKAQVEAGKLGGRASSKSRATAKQTAEQTQLHLPIIPGCEKAKHNKNKAAREATLKPSISIPNNSLEACEPDATRANTEALSPGRAPPLATQGQQRRAPPAADKPDTAAKCAIRARLEAARTGQPTAEIVPLPVAKNGRR